jgi:hypothetical protein
VIAQIKPALAVPLIHAPVSRLLFFHRQWAKSSKEFTRYFNSPGSIKGRHDEDIAVDTLTRATSPAASALEVLCAVFSLSVVVTASSVVSSCGFVADVICTGGVWIECSYALVFWIEPLRADLSYKLTSARSVCHHASKQTSIPAAHSRHSPALKSRRLFTIRPR